jgi:heme/copper-type cytochrome/quinol oxidase subunit 2
MTELAERTSRMELLQWFGLFGAFAAWVGQLVIGFSVSEARCGAANYVWHVDYEAWQIGLMAVGIVVALLSEVAAIAVFRKTRNLEHDDPPPWGRRNFFAAAAIVGNVLFILAILLGGLGAIYHSPCKAA